MKPNQLLHELCQNCSKKDNRLVHIVLNMVKDTIKNFPVYNEQERLVISNILYYRIFRLDFDSEVIKELVIEIAMKKLADMPIIEYLSKKDKI